MIEFSEKNVLENRKKCKSIFLKLKISAIIY